LLQKETLSVEPNTSKACDFTFQYLFFLSSQAKVQEYYKQMNDLVTETYSEEDQQIIGCPSIQQVSTSTVGNDKSISHIFYDTTAHLNKAKQLQNIMLG